MRIAIVALLLACLAVQAKAESNAHPGSAVFPSELEGVWDAYPRPCSAGKPSDSDMRFTIEGRMRHNYEDADSLVSIEDLAVVPRAWRVSSTSSLDPDQALVDSNIYVLAEDRLTVTDGRRTEVYVRCR